MGPDARLMVDAVSNYDVARAIAFARAVADCEIYWFEQPLPVEDVDGPADGPRAWRDPGVRARERVRACGRTGDCSRPRPSTSSSSIPSFRAALPIGRKIAALAEAFFKPVTLHHSNSIVSMLANLHLAASVPNAESVEYHVYHHPLFDLAPTGMLDIEDGFMRAPDRPGLGIDWTRLPDRLG